MALTDQIASLATRIATEFTTVRTEIATKAPNDVPVRSVSANTTAVAGELLRVNATSGQITVTPPASPAIGARVMLGKTDASTNAVVWSGTVNGDAQGAQIVTQHVVATLVWTGLDWTVQAVNGLPEAVDTTPVTAADFGLAVAEGARAYASGTAQMVTNGAYPVYLDVNAVEFNDNPDLFTIDLTNNRITVSESGLYFASWEVSYWGNSTAGTRDAMLTKNGGDALTTASGCTTGADTVAYRMTPLRLSPGDYMQVIAYVTGANTWIIENAAFRSGLALYRMGL